jgi:hypothetical protein
MLDLKSYFAEFRAAPALMDTSDCRTAISDCTCAVCMETRPKTERKIVALFDDYNSLSPEEDDELSPHHYLLCQFEVPAFVFKKRKWGKKPQLYFFRGYARRFGDH